MFFSLDLANLVLFCAQELGVAIGVGAQTVMMVAYFQAMRDGLVDAKEAQFLRATRRVSFFALALMVISGLLITALHIMLGDVVTILAPAYLFKWLLILLSIIITATAGAIPKNIFEALISGNWYALFFVHVLAPVISWTNLLEWWAVWLVGFNLCWYAAPYFARKGAAAAVSVPGVPDRVTEKQLSVKPPELPKPKEQKKEEKKEEQKIHIEERPVVPVPAKPTPQVAQPTANSLIKPILPQTLSITPTDIPMPANKATDTPFLPKVPPLQPIPTPAVDPAAPKAPDAAPQLQKPETLAPQDTLAINVMPKSPNQVQK